MDKVYLVITEQGSYNDYMWLIHCICSNPFKAEYEKKFNSNYDEDYENRMNLEQETRWNQIYNFEDKYPELQYHTIRIEEKQVL